MKTAFGIGTVGALFFFAFLGFAQATSWDFRGIAVFVLGTLSDIFIMYILTQDRLASRAPKAKA